MGHCYVHFAFVFTLSYIVPNGLRNIVFTFPGSFVLPSVLFPIYLCIFSDEVSKPEYNILSVV